MGLQKLFFVVEAIMVVVTATPVHKLSINAMDVETVAPETSSCDGATFPTECITATAAAAFIATSYTDYNVTSFGTQAALLSLMLYETDSFKYAKNHWPGVPGQGTRNMQSPTFNLKYATWLATNAPKAGITVAEVDAANVVGPANVLQLLLRNNAVSFGSAAGFLKTQCEDSIAEGLAAMSEEGWEMYLTECVGTTVTADRTAIWRAAIGLGGW